VDQVIAEVERLNERKRHENANRDWESYKAEQQRAERNGLLATDDDYAAMREALRKHFGDPAARPEGKRAEPAGSDSGARSADLEQERTSQGTKP
jgi:hypothetical protein